MLLKNFDSVNLRLRLMSSAIMAPVALVAVWLGGAAYGAVVGCAVAVGLYEWLRLVDDKAPANTIGTAGFLLVIAMAIGTFLSIPLAAVVIAAATVATYILSRRDGCTAPEWMAFGLPYMGGSGLALLTLRETPDAGMGLALFLLMSVWATDVGAFVAGRLIGGRKLAPSISPSKTWAGLAGGMVFATLAGAAVAALFGARLVGVAAVLSALLAAVAQGGDLFESYFKRRCGVKESGDLIPGHGGVLDRIDGLVAAAAILALFQSAFGQQLGWW